MTVVFKSDIKADSSANVSNFVGYTGPFDYYIYADISNQKYKIGASDVHLNDILTSPGQQKFYSISDKLGNFEDSLAGVPRRSFVPGHGVFAVMAETLNAGYVSGANLSIPVNSTATYAAYATKGKLLINTNDVILVGGSGTSVDPYLFKYKSLANIPYLMDRNDAIAICTQVVGNRVPLNIVKNKDNVSDADLSVKLDGINKNQFTVVIRTISPNLVEVLGNSTGYVPVIKFLEAPTKSISFVKNRNNSLNIQTRNNGNVQGEAQEAAPVTQVIDTYAISFNNGLVATYMNGAKINVPAVNQLPSFILNELKILSNDTLWSVQKNSDALVNLIIYNRALPAAELATCIFK